MDSLDSIRQLFEYDHWANGEALASLSTIAGDSEKARKYLTHVIGAQRIWLGRFKNPEPPAAEPWPALSVEACRAAMDETHRGCMGLLDSLTPEKLEENLTYRNLKGVEFQTPIRDVLMQLIFHGAYHRGQVAAAVREAGGKPSPTDFIVYARKMRL
ncbi:MAG: DinB family protein [Terriglobia bacterium]